MLDNIKEIILIILNDYITVESLSIRDTYKSINDKIISGVCMKIIQWRGKQMK